MKLKLRARHFKSAEFGEPDLCVIAIAAKELFDTEDVSEHVVRVWVNGSAYLHDRYDSYDFKADKEKAIQHGYSEIIIRTIQLNKV